MRKSRRECRKGVAEDEKEEGSPKRGHRDEETREVGVGAAADTGGGCGCECECGCGCGPHPYRAGEVSTGAGLAGGE